MNWGKIEKKNHIILIVPKDKLGNLQQGFLDVDYSEIIKDNYGFMSRGHVNDSFAESDLNYKQIIPYVVIVNPDTKKIYAYQRATNVEDSHESRLHGNWSWGVGGHVDFQDNIFEKGPREFLIDAMHREISEEIAISDGKIGEIVQIGYLNDDSNKVGQVHLGVIFIATTSSTNITPNDNESVHGEFLSYRELEDISKQDNVDNWSRIVLAPIKDFLEK